MRTWATVMFTIMMIVCVGAAIAILAGLIYHHHNDGGDP